MDRKKWNLWSIHLRPLIAASPSKMRALPHASLPSTLGAGLADLRNKSALEPKGSGAPACN